MAKEFFEKIAFISGASEGMGKETAFYFSSKGVNVVLCARRFELLESYAEEIRKKFGTEPLAVQMNVTRTEDVQRAVGLALEKYERIDFACNFAGFTKGYGIKEFRELTEADLMKQEVREKWKEELRLVNEIDHKGTLRVNGAVQSVMIKQKSGVILNISAITSVYKYSQEAPFVIAKRKNEEDARTRAERSERNGWGIRVYAIAPGDVFNPTTWNAYPEDERRILVKKGLIIRSEDVAEIVYRLFTGEFKEKYEMKLDLESFPPKILDQGKFVKLKNGDTIVVDSFTIPKLYEKLGLHYEHLIPLGYEWVLKQK